MSLRGSCLPARRKEAESTCPGLTLGAGWGLISLDGHFYSEVLASTPWGPVLIFIYEASQEPLCFGAVVWWL